MTEVPEELRYTEEHEYLREAEGENEVLVGITDYAQGELGDVVFVELPEPGEVVGQLDVFGTIEAVKAVSELFSPVSGEVLEVNQALEDDPALVNSDPYGEGWMIRVAVADPSELDDLMSASEYEEHISA